jgi:hypothetical protein
MVYFRCDLCCVIGRNKRPSDELGEEETDHFLLTGGCKGSLHLMENEESQRAEMIFDRKNKERAKEKRDGNY